MKTLILEGMPGSGKSSVVLNGLGPRIKEAAGYRTVRLFDTDHTRRGFALVDPGAAYGVDVTAEGKFPGQFVNFKADCAENIFHCEYLSARLKERLEEGMKSCLAGEKHLLLLDEVGGLELLDEELYEDLQKLFLQRVPVLAVVKSEPHARGLLGNMPEAWERYQALREKIRSMEIPVVTVKKETESRENAVAAVRSWLASLGE